MKQLTVISGKGGTGKTTIAAAFASLAQNAVMADCDVDAADLHLILKPEIKETQEFKGLKLAVKENAACTSCGECLKHCRFDAITDDYDIIPERCEGCGVCAHVCPVDCITLEERLSGHAYKSETRFGPMAHAVLKPGDEASGKLVSVVREYAKQMAQEFNKDLIIIDGPPGIGCPVIASIGGVDLVLVVTEPTISGIHDLERIIGVASHFGVPAAVCINKGDINPEVSDSIRKFCWENDLPLVAELPYDEAATKAMIDEKTLIEHSDCELSRRLKETWGRVMEELA